MTSRRTVLAAFIGTVCLSAGMAAALPCTAFAAAPEDLASWAGRLTDYQTLEADFRQTRTLSTGDTLTATGTLTVTADGGFVWAQKDPFIQTVRFTGQTFTTQYEDDKPEVMTEDSHPEVLAAVRLLSAVIRADLPALRESFSADLKETGDGAWTLTLKPTADLLQRLLGTVTLTGKAQVETVTMAPSPDNVTVITLSNIRTTGKKG